MDFLDPDAVRRIRRILILTAGLLGLIAAFRFTTGLVTLVVFGLILFGAWALYRVITRREAL